MDEDVEFRDMVLKKLEENGSLLDIKAKLRAYLYDVIENDGRHHHQEVVNDSDLTYNGDKTENEHDADDSEEQPEELDDRSVALGLVHDLLDCLKLPFTKRVLLAETGLGKPCSRSRLQREISGKDCSVDEEELEDGAPKEALLLQLIERRRKASASGTSEISQVSRDQSETTASTQASEESPAPV